MRAAVVSGRGRRKRLEASSTTHRRGKDLLEFGEVFFVGLDEVVAEGCDFVDG